MAQRGIDLSAEFPRPRADDVVRAADVLVTMGCGDSCPIYPGKRYLHWTVEDLAGKSLAETEQIAADLGARAKRAARTDRTATMTEANRNQPSALLACVKKGGKSQMAARLTLRAGDAFEVHSAGTKPGTSINRLSAESLAEARAVRCPTTVEERAGGAMEPKGYTALCRVSQRDSWSWPSQKTIVRVPRSIAQDGLMQVTGVVCCCCRATGRRQARAATAWLREDAAAVAPR